MVKVSLETLLSRVSKYVDEISELLRRYDGVVFEAYPGFGKTFLGLSVLKRFRSGTYITRTIAEMRVVMDIADMLGISVRPIYGRNQLCIRMDVKSMPLPLFSNLCYANRVLKLCNEAVDRGIISLISRCRDPDEIKELGVKHGICPYRAHLVLALSRKYVVTTYEYVYSHREVSELDREITILDECHAMLSLLENFVYRIDRYEILRLANEVKNAFPRLAYALRSIARKANDIYELLELLTKLVESSDQETLDIIEHIARAFRESKVYVSRDEEAAYILLRDIGIELGERKLFMTAYVPPFLTHRYPMVRAEDPPIKIAIHIDTSISSRYRERSQDFVSKLCEAVENYIDRTAANLIVVPSKTIAEELRYHLLRKGFRIAPPEAIDRVGDGTIVVDVAGGISTEGITPSRALKRVIVAGMPYPPPTPTLNLLSKVYGFDNTYTYIALLRTVQAIGRLMRWGGTAVLVDRRFKSYLNALPSWVYIESIS